MQTSPSVYHEQARASQVAAHAWMESRYPVFVNALDTWRDLRLALPHRCTEEPWICSDVVGWAKELSQMLQRYNQALWQDFPYCPACQGQCCNQYWPAASETDVLMLALLGIEPPPPPPAIDSQACIYQTPHGCSWPSQWKPLTCSLFFCPGRTETGLQKPYPDDAVWDGVIDALDNIVEEWLPPPLYAWQYLPGGGSLFPSDVPDPLDLVEVCGDALFEVFVDLLQTYFPSTDDSAGEWASTPSESWQAGPPGYAHFSNIFAYDPSIIAGFRDVAERVGATCLIRGPADDCPPLSRVSQALPGRSAQREIILDAVAIYVDKAHFEEFYSTWEDHACATQGRTEEEFPEKR